MNLRIVKHSKWNIYIYIVALFTILPNNFSFNLIRIILILFEIIKRVFCKKEIKLNKIHLSIFLFWISNIILGLLFVLISSRNDIDKVNLYHEVTRLSIYLILWLSLSNQKYSYIQLVRISKVLLVFHLTIQILQYFKVNAINDFIMMYYTQGELTKHLSLALETGVHFRTGSIYTNPNVYMVFPLLFLAIFLQVYSLDHMKKDLIWIALVIVSIILTGSRTTIIVIVLMLFLYIKIERKIITKFMYIFVVCVAAIYLVLNNELLTDFRVFDLFNGLNNSISVKIGGISDYFRNMKINNLFFGGLSDLNLPKRIDMELGYIFAWFGVLGYIWYYLIYLSLFKNLKNFTYLKFSVLIIFFLVSLTASTLLNYQAFNFISLLIYPQITNDEGEYYEI